jgi:hypothetical protein
MATSLTFTSAAFAGATTINVTTANTIILASNASDRRIYGISQTQTGTTAMTATIFLNNGTTNYNIGLGPAAGTVASVTTDIFGNSTLAAIFQKKKDANGAPYFDLPAGWNINVTQSSVASINYLITGESYA